MATAALLHDLGNIVKFDFDKYPEFLEEEQAKVELWKGKQKIMCEKYGLDDHQATFKMLDEINNDPRVKEIISMKGFGNLRKIVTSPDKGSKILQYADLRVLPNGVCTIEERINDVIERYPKYTNLPNFDDLANACRELEQQIQENIDVPTSEITSKMLPIDNEMYLKMEV